MHLFYFIMSEAIIWNTSCMNLQVLIVYVYMRISLSLSLFLSLSLSLSRVQGGASRQPDAGAVSQWTTTRVFCWWSLRCLSIEYLPAPAIEATGIATVFAALQQPFNIKGEWWTPLQGTHLPGVFITNSFCSCWGAFLADNTNAFYVYLFCISHITFVS